jgi:hypothetical protein
MTPSAPITPSTPHRLLDVGGAGFMGSRRRCDIVTFDNRSTASRDVAPGSQPLPLVAKKSAGRQALQWKPARFDLKTIVDDDWMRKENASQSGNA